MGRPCGGFSFLHFLIYITKEIFVIIFFLNVLKENSFALDIIAPNCKCIYIIHLHLIIEKPLLIINNFL